MSVTTVLDPINDLVEQAKRVLPGGSFGNMPAEVVLKEGKGGRIWDEAGCEYVDFLLGSGPMFVGHAHPEVTAAVQAQVPLGTTFFGNNRHGIALAEAICDAVPGPLLILGMDTPQFSQSHVAALLADWGSGQPARDRARTAAHDQCGDHLRWHRGRARQPQACDARAVSSSAATCQTWPASRAGRTRRFRMR